MAPKNTYSGKLKRHKDRIIYNNMFIKETEKSAQSSLFKNTATGRVIATF